MSGKDEGLVQEEWVYVGIELDGKGKKSYGWANVNAVHDIHWFNKNLATSSVGNTYFVYVRHGEGGALSVITKGDRMPTWCGRYDDKDKIKEWAIRDETARQILATKSMNTKASKEVALEVMFEDVRKASVNLNTTERLALIAKLSEMILRA